MQYSRMLFISSVLALCTGSTIFSQESAKIEIPDALIAEAYAKAGTQNVLAAVNPLVFYGYFSVCADGVGFGYGNTYPSLDGHQMSDALLRLGQTDVVKANWDYVKGFQKENGQLPIAVFPSQKGKLLGPEGFQQRVDSNGGFYKHWVPGDPLRALASTTYIQNADVIFRFTQDREWLRANLSSVNLSGNQLASLITAEGAVGGAGYYVERPLRKEYDGVSQCHAVDAFDRLAELNAIGGNNKEKKKFRALARLVEENFQKTFWVKDRFAEYIHPDSGKITAHGLTDVDWSAIATKSATPAQVKLLWPQLKRENRFYYGGMPTGIVAYPDKYQPWESSYQDNQDLAAMGRVWYLDAWARYNMNDAEGLIRTLQSVSKAGRDSNYYWRERYNETGGYGAKKYNEYPANLIRIVQRFLMGVEFELNGDLSIKPLVTEEFWEKGFGQTLSWNTSTLTYDMKRNSIQGSYTGEKKLNVCVRMPQVRKGKKIKAVVNGTTTKTKIIGDCIRIELPATKKGQALRFEINLL